ncbi:MAG TPA: ankyrin repeat domain-containing protein, partial [Steroidobacteraceae bacterium]|nr:ankyrin repeat domain-containing protein [Steroidobacteraceae bacterium]
NGEDKNGRTPLIDAIAGEKWSAVDFLLNRGATLTTTKFDARAVGTELLEKNQPQILRRYVAAYPMLKEQLVSNPEWLHFAAKKSGEASIKYLLDLGADVNQPSKTSVSPLMTAVNAGNVDTVKALLANKANSAQRDARGRTALQVAIQSGSTKVVAAMRELGVRE